MLIFPFPHYEFTDKDNFGVFRDTIRAPYFNKKRYIHGVLDKNDEGNLLNWDDEESTLGIQVVDSTMDIIYLDKNEYDNDKGDIDINDFRKYIEINIMLGINSINFNNILK